MLGGLKQRPDFLPSAAVALTGVSWGLFWLPLRAFDEAGLQGAWATFAFYLVALLILTPFAIARWRHLRDGGAALFFTGLLTGSAFALYATSLLLTEVVRALLLFYMTPVWSTLLGAVLLKERITVARGLALVLGLAGLLVILGLDDGFPLPRNVGDWMGLLSGMAWAYGSLRVFSAETKASFEPVFAFFASGILIGVLFLLLPFEGMGEPPSGATLRATTPWLLAMVVLFVLPAMFLVFWGAARLSPGRVGILLMGEVVVGVVSAAIMTDEPFGAREIIGSLLVIGAGLIEVSRQQPAGDMKSPVAANSASPGPGAA